jgi:DNA processing protein
MVFENCKRIVQALAPYDVTIVSGMAFGIDIIAQRQALKEGLNTLGCLAHGLNRMYPKQHQKYTEAIMAQGGLVSEFLPDAPFDRSNFIRRNRIIAGLAQATLVIESGVSGGSLVTANFAQQYQREVFALPGAVDAPKSSGCLRLIKNQEAQLLQAPEDLFNALQLETAPIAATKAVKAFETNDPEEKKVWEVLHKEPKCSLDVLAFLTQLPVHVIASKLIVLEMKGVVRSLPGKLFELR